MSSEDVQEELYSRRGPGAYVARAGSEARDVSHHASRLRMTTILQLVGRTMLRGVLVVLALGSVGSPLEGQGDRFAVRLNGGRALFVSSLPRAYVAELAPSRDVVEDGELGDGMFWSIYLEAELTNRFSIGSEVGQIDSDVLGSDGATRFAVPVSPAFYLFHGRFRFGRGYLIGHAGALRYGSADFRSNVDLTLGLGAGSWFSLPIGFGRAELRYQPSFFRMQGIAEKTTIHSFLIASGIGFSFL